MARPVKSDADKRTFVIRLRVTESEKSDIWQNAKEAGLIPSDFLRGLVLKTKPSRNVPTPDRELLLKILAELGKQGSNLNQIARAYNRKQDGDDLNSIDTELVIHILQSNDQLQKTLMDILTT